MLRRKIQRYKSYSLLYSSMTVEIKDRKFTLEDKDEALILAIQELTKKLGELVKHG